MEGRWIAAEAFAGSVHCAEALAGAVGVTPGIPLFGVACGDAQHAIPAGADKYR